MAGVEQQRDVRSRALARERAQRLGQLDAVGVEFRRYLEPEPAQRGGQVDGVVLGIRQPPDVGVGVVADDQRHLTRQGDLRGSV